jgi:hypothetical protein
MTDAMMLQALRRSVEFEETERNMRRMIAYQKIAKKAYSKWLNAVEDYKRYDKAYAANELWTILETKQALHEKSMAHWCAYIRCIASVRNIKKTI